MSSILCLAHYCDTHGPTPLMVTEGLPVGCKFCFDDESIPDLRPNSPPLTVTGGGSNAKDKKEDGRVTPELPPTSSGLREGSLESSRRTTNGHRRDSSFRKTYDENDKKRAIPCENCALTLPKQTKEPSPSGMSAKHVNGPVLRTRKPFERVVPIEGLSPPKSDCCSSDSGDDHVMSKMDHGIPHVDASSSSSSFTSSLSHTHYLDYTSTHEPLAPTAFSMVRQSCLRTLSCETLPPSTTQQPAHYALPPVANSPFATSSSAMGTASGGPIFFGDPQAGYTTAYIFRIPDPSARGRRRVYALMALSTHRERLAMQTFSFLSQAFRDLAIWIQGLAEAELERSSASLRSPLSPGLSDEYSPEGTKYSRLPASANPNNTSSLLSGLGRGFDGKFAGVSLRSRGLAELVGLPDFFIELHARFVRLLIELSVVLGT